MKENIKKAFQDAEQELEDKEVKHLKEIIQKLLQKKKDKEQERAKIDEDVRLIKQEIEDFRAGRLDKIKERHEKNPKANDVCPIHITIINDNTRVVYPTQPWRWNYEVVWGTQTLTGYSNNLVYCSGNASVTTTAMLNGTTSATYTSGTYNVNGNSISL